MRLAVVIHPPGSLARALAMRTSALDLPPTLATPPDRLRLVVQHIGEATPDEAAALMPTIRRAARGLAPFWLRPLRLVSMPRNEPTRRIVVELDTPPTLLELKRRLAQRLARSPRRDPADRFVPHITLLRLESPTPDLDIDETIDLPGFPVDCVTLEETGRLRKDIRRREPKRPVGVVTLEGPPAQPPEPML